MKKFGFSLLELLIAMGIFGIVLIVSFDSIGGIYYSYQRTSTAQNFHDEVRFLMERIAHLVRENTIDYDRYFYLSGPDTTNCAAFDSNQRPDLADDSSVCDAANGSPCPNTRANRFALGDNDKNVGLGYSNIFFWDTNGDDQPDKNLGGKDLTDTIDPCTQAFATTNIDWDDTNGNPAFNSIMVINSDRDTRHAIRYVQYTQNGEPDVFGRIELQTQLLADTNSDGIGDLAGPMDINEDGDFDDTGEASIAWNELLVPNQCEITFDGTTYPILGEQTEENCESAHEWTSISFEKLNITEVEFIPSPDSDPFLTFRRDETQVHPQTWIRMNVELKNFADLDYDDNTKPQINLQTSVSSRVYGNTRK